MSSENDTIGRLITWNFALPYRIFDNYLDIIITEQQKGVERR